MNFWDCCFVVPIGRRECKCDTRCAIINWVASAAVPAFVWLRKVGNLHGLQVKVNCLDLLSVYLSQSIHQELER